MDNDQINYIRHRLQRYEESIQETEDHFDQLESFGCYRACAPWSEKFGIPLLIDALKSDDDRCDTFWNEYDRITGKLTVFATRKGTIYRDLLYEDLKNYVAVYHSALCYADLNMIAVESDHDLFNREAIRALLAELRRDYDTMEMENLVTTLDESFLRMRETIERASSEKTQEPERVYMPLIARDENCSACGENEPARHV